MKYLNLGCGNRFHPDWINVDLYSTNDNVISADITEGVPFQDGLFKFVYSSHLIEHLNVESAKKLLQECFRVLETDGIIRVVAPDLEKIVRIYLEALEGSLNGSTKWEYNYNWILLELYDQMTRNSSGGEMIKYLMEPEIPNEEFVINRIGTGIALGGRPKEILRNKKINEERSSKTSFILKNKIKSLPSYVKEKLIKVLLGREYELLQIGRFRERGGEIHKWMYDRYSLSKLLKESGFTNIINRSEVESYVEDWASWNLDTNCDGSIYKPDSFYLEAVK